MESTVTTIQDPAFTENEQFKLIACCSCGMFQYFSMRYLKVNYNLNLDISGGFRYTCLNCHEKFSLMRQVDGLNGVNRKLQDRISALVHLREEEDSFDQTLDSMGLLTNKFENFSINASNTPQQGQTTESQPSVTELNTSSQSNVNSLGVIVDGVCIPHTCETQFVNNSTINSNFSKQSHNTSIWSGLDASETNINYTLPSEVLQPNVSLSLSSESSLPNTGSETLPNNELNTSTLNLSVTEKKQMSTDDMVEVLFAGDRTIKRVNLLAYTTKDKYFKAVHPNATISSTKYTVDYLLRKRHKNVKTVVIQTGASNVINTPSESVKEDFKSLAKYMKNSEKQIIISGPIPMPRMNSETFSRLLELNLWLTKWTSEQGILFR